MIIFSQAPADIQYVLSLYHKYKDSYNLKIIVVNIENNYKFLKSLKLDAELKFIPTVSQKKPFRYTVFIFKLRFLYKELFADTHNIKIYFFSKNYDYVTSFFIEKLAIKNEVTFVDIYKQNFIEKNSIVNDIKKRIMYYALGIKVYFNHYSYIYILNKKIKKMSMIVQSKDISQYKYNIIPKNNHKKNILFFESNINEANYFVDYQRDLMNIVTRMKEYCNIYIKPHPRLGHSRFLDKYSITIIEDYVPSELLNLEKFNMIFGVETTAIATSDFKDKYCLINLFEYNDLNRKRYIINYLNKLSVQNIAFLENLDDVLRFDNEERSKV